MQILREILYNGECYNFVSALVTDLDKIITYVEDTDTGNVHVQDDIHRIFGVVKSPDVSYNNMRLECYKLFALPKHFYTFLGLVDEPELIVKKGTVKNSSELSNILNKGQQMELVLPGILKGDNKLIFCIGSNINKLDDLGIFWECDSSWNDIKPLQDCIKSYTRTSQGGLTLYHIYDIIFNLGIEIKPEDELYMVGYDFRSDLYKLTNNTDVCKFFTKLKVLRG